MTGTITALNLARAQFAFTLTFHFIFPAFSIGLASYLAVLEGLWLKTGKTVYDNLFRYWLKIFSIVFAMGTAAAEADHLGRRPADDQKPQGSGEAEGRRAGGRMIAMSRAERAVCPRPLPDGRRARALRGLSRQAHRIPSIPEDRRG